MTNYQPRYVYLLKSTTSRKTYIGFSTNPSHRLRQHNGEIKGGAKYTRYGRPWKLILAITGFPSAHLALSFEWWNHHPHKYNQGRSIQNKIKTIKHLLLYHPKFNTFKTFAIFYDTFYDSYW